MINRKGDKMRRKEFSKHTKEKATRFIPITTNPVELGKSYLDLGPFQKKDHIHHRNPCKDGGSNSPRNAIGVSDITHRDIHKGYDQYGLEFGDNVNPLGVRFTKIKGKKNH